MSSKIAVRKWSYAYHVWNTDPCKLFEWLEEFSPERSLSVEYYGPDLAPKLIIQGEAIPPGNFIYFNIEDPYSLIHNASKQDFYREFSNVTVNTASLVKKYRFLKWDGDYQKILKGIQSFEDRKLIHITISGEGKAFLYVGRDEVPKGSYIMQEIDSLDLHIAIVSEEDFRKYYKVEDETYADYEETGHSPGWDA